MYTYPENSKIYNMTIHLYSECHICTMLNNNLHVLAYILFQPVQIVVVLLFSTNIIIFVFTRKESVPLFWIRRNTLPSAMSHDGG